MPVLSGGAFSIFAPIFAVFAVNTNESTNMRSGSSSLSSSPFSPDSSPGIVIEVKRLSCCMPLALPAKKRAARNECKMTSLFYTSFSPRVPPAMNRERSSGAS